MSDSATCTASLFAPGHLGELTGIVPPEMVDAALAAGGGQHRRLRLIPSRVVVYLLLAGALFAGQGWRSVWSPLTTGLSQASRRPCASALTGAMRRVGPAPLRELFTILAGPAASLATHRVRFAGRLVVAIDGTQLAIADTDANRARFPKTAGGPNGPAGYPMIRLVAIVATGTRTIIDAVFGSDRLGELTYATASPAPCTVGCCCWQTGTSPPTSSSPTSPTPARTSSSGPRPATGR